MWMSLAPFLSESERIRLTSLMIGASSLERWSWSIESSSCSSDPRLQIQFDGVPSRPGRFRHRPSCSSMECGVP